VDVTPAQAVEHLMAGLSRMGPHAERRGVTILMEPLAPHLCNVVNTLGEALRVADRASSPAVQTMFDTHNTTAETEPHAELIRRHIGRIRHVHLNELDGRYPGSGGFPFAPVLNALRDAKYRGWLSVEVFDFKPDGETVARKANEFLRRTANEN
jgi:sugar phosphate isomerase/epimerase